MRLFAGSGSSERRGDVDLVAQTVGRVEGIVVGGRFQLGAFFGGQRSKRGQLMIMIYIN